MNFFKKLATYFKYLSLVKNNSMILFSKHKLRIDYIGRLYTVFSFSEKERLYGFETDFAKNRIREYVSDVLITLNTLGISDIISIETKALDEFANINEYSIKNVSLENTLSTIKLVNTNYLIIFKFNLLNIPRLLITSLILILVLLLCSFIIFI